MSVGVLSVGTFRLSLVYDGIPQRGMNTTLYCYKGHMVTPNF